MRVFVAGATGVVGRRAVAALTAAGHDVTAIARSEEKAELLRALGVRPVSVGLFDRDALRDAVAGHEAVVNLATKIPPISRMARASAWAENERIRREASGNLVDAAIAGGAVVFVQESLAFAYGDHGDALIDATSAELADSPYAEALRAAEANVARFTAAGGRGVVLRYGRFYAPDSDHTRAMVEAARRGVHLDVGRDDAYAPLIDADDAASAVVRALDAPAGVYDVVDDRATTRGEQAAVLASAVGRRALRRPPSRVLPSSASILSDSQRVSNARFRDATGWRPASPDAAAGYPKVVRALGTERSLPTGVRVLLWLLGISSLTIGVQAAFFPRSFYADFPLGRGWVALDGRYNEHLVRDVGALNLALTILTLGALLVATRAVARLASAGYLAYAIPHFVYHLRHIGMSMPGTDKVGILVSLGLAVVAPIMVLVALVDRRATRGIASAREARAVRVPRTGDADGGVLAARRAR